MAQRVLCGGVLVLLALAVVYKQQDSGAIAELQPGSGEALALTRQQMKQMKLSSLRREHSELSKRLKEVRERLENRRLEHKVTALRSDIDALRQERASVNRRQVLRSAGKVPWSKSLAQSFTDDDNPLYEAKPADKVMDPEERPFLRGPGPHRGDLSHPETGDYASVNTYGNLVDNKENMDWCAENFDFVHDRIKCIKKLNPAGPALA